MTHAPTSGPRRLPAEHAEQPPRLRIWSAALELARDLFPLARKTTDPLSATLIRPLLDASLRLCISAARSRGEAPAGLLREAAAELAEIETRLCLCAELELLAGDEHSRLVRRIAEMRQALSSEGMRGSALVLVVILSSVVAVLGMLLLGIADTESALVRRTREREQLVQAAETGARMVKAWFDAPITGERGAARRAFLGRFDLREAALFERDVRLIDADGNPATALVRADGSPGRERWRDGRAFWADTALLDLFHKPWGGGIPEALLGSASGPDLLLADRDGTDLLDEINSDLFGIQTDGVRIDRIAIHAPRRNASTLERQAFATVEVEATLHRRLDRSGGIARVPPGARPSGRAVVRMGLAEIRTGSPRGPLQVCGNIEIAGTLRASWGPVTAAGDIRLATADLDGDAPSTWPFDADGSHIGGLFPGDPLERWLAHAPALLEDPWLRIVAGGSLIGMEGLPSQPLPHDPAAAIDADHSNLFQGAGASACPSFDYLLWKRRVTQMPPGAPGESRIWHLVPEAGTGLYRRSGRGPARSVRDWTHRQEGIFFFDTMDGLPPNGGNLAPPVAISGGEWHTAGLILMHAESFEVSNVTGTIRAVFPPGEPFEDADASGDWSPGETFVNLRYPDAADLTGAPGDFTLDPAAAGIVSLLTPEGDAHRVTATPSRDPKGFPILLPVNLFGVLYNTGDIVADSDATHFGSLLAGRNIITRTPGAASARILYDERLASGEWPPPEIAMPRTWITFWEVDGL